ncbi:MAG TPA: glycosyltransferase [Blastocatellia bacterium]|nr:glycosyltransferase [Blastocatellia bacterium]
MIDVLYTLMAVLILQGLISLWEGTRFSAFVHRSLQRPSGTFTPKATIIVPCKGIDAKLDENLRALFEQDYPEFEIIFSIASADDPTRRLIESVIAEKRRTPARLIVAGGFEGRSEKINNLLAAIDQVSADCEVMVFADSDVRVHKDWLERLVAPLADRGVGAATGYRWVLPERRGLCAAVLSAWNGSVATTLGDHGRNFAWGGSTAIRRDTFERIGVRKRWEHAVSDDYSLTSAVNEAGLRVVFVPRCLVATREAVTFRSLIEFTTRQVIITRVYRPGAWWVGLISHALFTFGFFGGIAFAASAAMRGTNATLLFMMIGAIYLLGSIKGALRLSAAREALVDARSDVVRLWWMFCLLWPLVSLVFLYNFLASAATRRIRWRGVAYEMRSPSETRVLR